MVVKKKLVLASISPRRKYLLRQLGLSFEVMESRVSECFDSTKSPAQNVKDIALQKAQAVAPSLDSAIVIGADTTVALDDRNLGKPEDAREAIKMLMDLSGRTHEVYTGFALVDRPSDKWICEYERTSVTFRKLTRDEIEEYVRSGSPMDKAGAYGIQDDYGAVFVEKVDGCFYNVVGFPLARFYVAMREFQNELGLL